MIEQVEISSEVRSEFKKYSFLGFLSILFTSALAFLTQTYLKLNVDALIVLYLSLSFVQIFFIWLVFYRPIYKTLLQQNRKMNEAILESETANRSKTEFLANISHEIRTPMTAILGYADILKREGTSFEEKDDAIRVIDQNATHLISLIDDILDISKIESNKFTIEKEKIDLVVLLNEVYSLINVKAEEKGIKLSFHNTGEIPKFIYIDPKRLKQILFNIIGNAIKFTEKGFIKLDVSFDKQSKTLFLKVQDTGIGISSEQKKKLFKPFAQADTSVGRKYGGSGLGLVLSRQLAKSMNGNIEVLDSNIGIGTTMQISLNLSPSSSLHEGLVNHLSTNIIQDTDEDYIEDSLKNINILVVDDAKENAHLFELYLSEAGANVDTAHNGEVALLKSSRKCYDIILLDLQMPGMDGFQVIRQLKKSKYRGPVVALTAHAMKEEKEKTKQAGFNDHITKPVRPGDLIAAVSNHVGHK